MSTVVLCVGKLREKAFRQMADEYLKRLGRFGRYEETEVADLPESGGGAALEEQIRNTAVSIYQIMGCRGLSRVDFFLREGPDGGYDEGELVFNEINTMPGFTKISMYPQLWEASGIAYEDLIDRLVELALE